MRKQKLDRRRVLGLGLGAGAAGTLLAGTARGFQIQDMPPATERLYRLACEAPARHAQLLAEIDAQLAGRRLGESEIQAIRAKATCPLCGCALAQADPAAIPGDAPEGSPGDKPAGDSSL